MKRKLKLKYTRSTKSTNETFIVECDFEEQIDPSSQNKKGLVSDYLPVIVSVGMQLLREALNYI